MKGRAGCRQHNVVRAFITQAAVINWLKLYSVAKALFLNNLLKPPNLRQCDCLSPARSLLECETCSVPMRHSGDRSGITKPNRTRRYASAVDHLAEKVASLHTTTSKDIHEQGVLELKLALLAEMCNLFEAAAPVLRTVQQTECLKQNQDHGDDSSKATAAMSLLESYMDTISNQAPSRAFGSPQASCSVPGMVATDFNAGRSAGWDTDQPSASTFAGWGHLALLANALAKATEQPGLLEAAQNVSESLHQTFYPRFRGGHHRAMLQIQRIFHALPIAFVPTHA